MNKRVYLDYAASTPLDGRVQKAMLASIGNFANPSAVYQSALEARRVLEGARKECALFLQCNSDEIVFTSGATESNNIAIFGASQRYKNGRIISITTEHSSVYEPLQKLKKNGFDVKYLKVDKTGLVDVNELAKLLTKNTRLVTISYASGEIGTIQPLIRIGQLIKAYNASRNSKILFHTDASAAALVLSCDVSRLGVDLLTLGGAKLYGPHGSGLLYVRRGSSILPIEFGGGQENGLRPGTQSVESAVGLGSALTAVKKERKKDHLNFKKLHEVMLLDLDKSVIDYHINGNPKERLFNIISLVLPGHNGEDLVAKLDVAGYEVSTGAACEAANEKPSRGLLAIGLNVADAQSSLRISFGRNTMPSEIKGFVSELKEIVAR